MSALSQGITRSETHQGNVRLWGSVSLLCPELRIEAGSSKALVVSFGSVSRAAALRTYSKSSAESAKDVISLQIVDGHAIPPVLHRTGHQVISRASDDRHEGIKVVQFEAFPLIAYKIKKKRGEYISLDRLDAVRSISKSYTPKRCGQIWKLG